MSLPRRDFLHGVLTLPGVASLGYGIAPSLGSSVRSGGELKAALRAATPGTTIVLTPGDFGGVTQFELTVPNVTLRASVPLRSILRSPLVVRGDYARIVDLAFRGDGEDNLHMVAVAACKDSILITSNDVEVNDCDFSYFPQRAIFVRSGLRSYIHDCSFHNNTKGSIANSHEAIGLGYSNQYSRTSMKARIINNKFPRPTVLRDTALQVEDCKEVENGRRRWDGRGPVGARPARWRRRVHARAPTADVGAAQAGRRAEAVAG